MTIFRDSTIPYPSEQRQRARIARYSIYALLCLWMALVQIQAVPILLAQESEATIELAAYQQLIEQAAAELMQPSADDDVVAHWQQQLASVNRVRLPDGAVVTPRPLLGLPDDDPLPSPAVARARVTAVLDQLLSTSSDRTAARLASLEDVLARAEFSQPETLWQRFQRWLAQVLARFLPDAMPDPTSNGALRTIARAAGWLIALAGILLLAWLLSFWLQALLANFVPHAAKRRAGDGVGDLPSSAQAARVVAAEHAGSGDYRQAVRHLYLAALLSLDERGLVRFERSLTNREVLARTPEDATLRTHLEPVIATFDRIWYGVQEPDHETFETYRHEVDELDQILSEAEDNGS